MFHCKPRPDDLGFNILARWACLNVVDFTHDIKSQGIYAFVTPMAGVQADENLKKELVKWVREKIGPIATPDIIYFSDDLPKTRSGKIMRRILRKIVNNQSDQLGDISTLSNPEVVEKLIQSNLF